MRDVLEPYKTPLIIALLLHAMLLIFLGWHWSSRQFTEQIANTSPVIQATTVSAEQISSMSNVKPPTLAVKSISPASEQLHEPEQPSQVVENTSEILKQREQQKLLKQQQVEPIEQDKLKASILQKQAEQKALEQARLQQIEAEKVAAALKKQQAEQAAKAKKAEELKRVAQAAAFKKQQEQMLAQELEDEAKALSSIHASSVNQGEIDKYKALIVQAIGREWLVPADTADNLSCKLLIHLAPGGAVLSAEIIQSSGNPALDRSARTAVYKASPLPVPDEANLFDKFRVVSLTVRPERAHSE